MSADEEREPTARELYETYFLRCYARGGNPLDAWRAYMDSRMSQRPIPDLVLQYFDRVADNFFRLTNSITGPKTLPADPAPAIADALEMTRRGRGSVLTRARARGRAESIAEQVAHAIVFEGAKPSIAMEEVARVFKVGRETVRRAWQQEYESGLRNAVHALPPSDPRWQMAERMRRRMRRRQS